MEVAGIRDTRESTVKLCVFGEKQRAKALMTPWPFSSPRWRAR
jgi:hypothetical protein